MSRLDCPSCHAPNHDAEEVIARVLQKPGNRGITCCTTCGNVLVLELGELRLPTPLELDRVKNHSAEWAAMVMTKATSEVQRQEMERAFYAGAFALFTLCIAEIAALPDDQAEEQMSAIEKELKDYFRLILTIPGPHGTERQ